MGKIVSDELEIRRESVNIYDGEVYEISKITMKKVVNFFSKNPHYLEEGYKEKEKTEGGIPHTCDKRDCDFHNEDNLFNCGLENAMLGLFDYNTSQPDCVVYRNKEREANALAWIQAQAAEIAGKKERSVSDCTRLIASVLKLKSKYDWENVVKDCEQILGLEGHAENPMSSNLPNAVRDLKANKTPGEIKIIYDCTKCSHKKVCPILFLYKNSGIEIELKTCSYFDEIDYVPFPFI
jgi:hypothetical protein